MTAASGDDDLEDDDVLFAENSLKKEKGWRIGRPFSSYDASSNWRENSTAMSTGFVKQVTIPV